MSSIGEDSLRVEHIGTLQSSRLTYLYHTRQQNNQNKIVAKTRNRDDDNFKA